MLCWLALSEAEKTKTVNVSVTDNVSEESAPRLYQNIPVGVYASSAPYASYSFHVPVVQHVAASQVAPKSVPIQNTNGYINNLKDSYGKFVQVPKSMYKMFPQHYLQLQELPAHLSQPLVAASPSLQYKQTAPHFIFGSQNYQLPYSHQAATPTPITRYTGPSQPLVYAEHIRNFAPSSGFYSQVHNFPTSQTVAAKTQQQQSSSRNVHSSAPSTSYQQVQGISQAQALNDKNQESKQNEYDDTHGKIQAAPAQTSVTAIVNGKQTVITLDTKPPLPLLDLNLLEPLTFANPLVPQVQHFLPRINQATYHKLPNFNVNNEKKHQKEVVVQKTTSYDGGHIKGKPQSEKPKKKTQPRSQSNPAKPKITVKGTPEEFTYEINTPNHKETYNEQVLSYNKETNMKPVEYTYNSHTQKKPVHYSFVHSSKEPLHIKHVEYESDPQNPKQLIFKFSPEQSEQNDEGQRPPDDSEESDESDESSESEDDNPAPHPQREQHGSHENTQTHPQNSQQHQEAPRYHHSGDSGHFAEPVIHQYHPEHKEHHGKPAGPAQSHHVHQSHNGNTPSHSREHNDHRSHQTESPRHFHSNSEHGHHGEAPRHSHSYNEHNNYHSESPRHPHSQSGHHGGTPSPSYHDNKHDSNLKESPKYLSHSQNENSPRQVHHHSGHHEESPRQSQHLKPEHREEYHHAPNHEAHQPHVHSTPHYYAQPLTVTVQNAFQPITHEYEEEITILPTHEPHRAHIKVDPNQHVQLGPSTPYHNTQPSPAPQKIIPQQEHHNRHYEPHNSPPQHIHEKSKHIIIKEKEDSPDEMHVHTEQLVAQMVEQDENNEEDFEKAYKESAYGFPAYEKSTDLEKDIYNPQTYGVPRYTEFKLDETPFQKYEEEGDEFPRSARLTYKDDSHKKKENYFLDYSISKPESFTDHYKKKEDYYKTYKKYRPEKMFVHENDERKKEKQKEKYITAPSHPFVYPAPASIPKQQQFFAQYKAVPNKFVFEYPKAVSSDSSAHASRPYSKFRTHFVEPQYQYGFEPISAPLVLDSELAAMASNNSPESEKPGTRKKIYKENWYIKKTSTTAGKPS